MQWFDRQITLPTRIIITGKTGSGKSFLANWLLYLLCDDLDELYVFSPTESGEFRGVCDKNHVFREWTDSVVASIFDSQQSIKDSRREMPRIMILIDDSVWDIAKNNKWLSKIFTMGRHWNLSCIIITQKFRLLTQALRSNCDYVFITKTINTLEKEALFKEYGVGTVSEFYDKLHNATKDFGSLVIDCNTMNDEIFFTRELAPPHIPPFWIENIRAQKNMEE